jgi:hypothetical protein
MVDRRGIDAAPAFARSIEIRSETEHFKAAQVATGLKIGVQPRRWCPIAHPMPAESRKQRAIICVINLQMMIVCRSRNARYR